MGTSTSSINGLLNRIAADEILLPDLQRDFVWDRGQIQSLLDSAMRGYPFGTILLWNTHFIEVPYRAFSQNVRAGDRHTTQVKSAGIKRYMVLDGQQRLQSLYVAARGSLDGRSVYFNILSGSSDDESDDDRRYRFEFWQDGELNRPKRLIRVADVLAWARRNEDDEIDRIVEELGLDATAVKLARRNLRHLRETFQTENVVPVQTIDDEITDAKSAWKIDEILDIFVRVNQGGTRLTRADLMFSFIKTQWTGARAAFDDLLQSVNADGALPIDQDFVIRGLLMVSDSPISVDVTNIDKHWSGMGKRFDGFYRALRAAIDFCREPDVGLLSAKLLQPINSLLPVVYYLARQPNASVPDAARKDLRALMYFLLFNEFAFSDARLRYLRDAFRGASGASLPFDALLGVITRQKNHSVTTTHTMLQWNHRLALNIAQPGVAKRTLSWQARPEVDHIFPQSRLRPKHGDLADDIGNFAYLGKLRNIRKSDTLPADYFKDTSDEELREQFLIEDRALLAEDRFPEFVEARRSLILAKVKAFLGR